MTWPQYRNPPLASKRLSTSHTFWREMLMGWRRVSGGFPSPRCFLRLEAYRRAFSIGPSLPASSKLGNSLRRSASHLQGSHSIRLLGFRSCCVGASSKDNPIESSREGAGKGSLSKQDSTS